MASGRLRIGHGPSYDTSWPADENPIAQAVAGTPRWTVGGGGFYNNIRSLGGLCYGAATSSGYDDCLAMLDTPTIGNNHRVEVTVHRVVGYDPRDGDGNRISHEIGAYVRRGRAGSSNEFVTGYECLFPIDGGGDFQIIGWLGTTHDDLSNFDLGISVTTMNGGLGTIAHGDVLAAQIVGSTIKCYRNGTQFAQATDTRYSTGKPGLGFFIRPGGTPASFCISRYRALVAT